MSGQVKLTCYKVNIDDFFVYFRVMLEELALLVPLVPVVPLVTLACPV